MTTTVTIIKDGVTNAYGLPLVNGASYSLDDAFALSLVQQQKASVSAATPGNNPLLSFSYASVTGLVANSSASGASNATAIQAAIDAAFLAGGGTVIIPVGTYFVSTSLLMKSNVWLRGQGAGSILKLANSTAYSNSSNVIFVTPSSASISGWRISDLAIDGNRSNQSLGSTQDNAYNGICVRGSQDGNNYTVSNFSIENVTANNCGYHGIAIYGGCSNFRIANGYHTGNGFRGIHIHGGDTYGVTDYEVTNNRVTANGVDSTTGLQTGLLSGLFVAFLNDTRGAVVGNTVWTEPGVGLEVTGYSGSDTVASEHVSFTSNTVYDCGTGFKIGGEIKNVTLTGNTVKNINTTSKGAGANGVGIHLSSAGTLGGDGITLTGNVVTACTSWGIFSDPASNLWRNCTLTGNVVSGCGTNTGSSTGGVRLASFSASTFTGNTIFQNNSGAGAPRQLYILGTVNTVIANNSVNGGTANFPAIEADSTSSNIVVTNNYVNRNSGSGTAITFTAANSFCYGNILQGSNTVNNNGTGNVNATMPISTTGAVTPTLGTNAPTGVTTPQAWLPVNVAGTTRYVPAW